MIHLYMAKNVLSRTFVIAAAMLILGSCSPRVFEKSLSGSRDGYRLTQVVAFSRHNIRTPLTGSGSITDSLTPNKGLWYNWEVPAGELSLKGGTVETLMGQYFRIWLEDSGLIPHNWQPSRREARFYSNSLQRTVATARYFASGMVPVADVGIEYHPHKRDRVFLPLLSTDSEAFKQEAAKELNERLSTLGDSLACGFATIERVLDFDKSPWFAAHGRHLQTEPVPVRYVKGKEPRMGGSLKTATSASDALVLQYYESGDPIASAFGKDLSISEWESISGIKDMYVELLFSLPVVGLNTAVKMLEEVRKEFSANGRKFSFLCGHDSSIISIMTALGAYTQGSLDAIEKRAPLGGKLVFEKYTRDGADYARLRLIYPSGEQLLDPGTLNYANPPKSRTVMLKGLKANSDGYYSWNEVVARINEAIKAGKQAGSGQLPAYLP